MLESVFVGLIVVAATAYAAWALTPTLSRNRFAARLAHGLGGPEAVSYTHLTLPTSDLV